MLGVNINCRPVDYFDKCYSMDQIDTVLDESHIIVLALPYTQSTHHMFKKDKFSAMRDKSDRFGQWIT